MRLVTTAAAVRGCRLGAFQRFYMTADTGLVHCCLRVKYPATFCPMTVTAASKYFLATDRVVTIGTSSGAMSRMGKADIANWAW